MSERDPALLELLDHRAISQLSIDYMRALDRLDGELLRSVYHPDATDDRGFFAGSGPEFCDFALGVLASHKTNHHMLGQMNIAIEGDIAFGEVYFNAYHRIESEGEGAGEEMDFVVIGRYVDRYERRDGTWKIAHRSELNDSCWTVPATDDWLRQTPSALRGARGDNDLSSRRDEVRRR